MVALIGWSCAVAAQDRPPPAPEPELNPIAPPTAPPSRSDVSRVRSSTRLLVGAGLTGGDLTFTSDSFNVEADLGSLNAVTVGVQAWPEEFAGVELTYQIGLLGELAVPQLEVQEGDAALTLASHRLEGGFLYRWFSGPRVDAVSVGLRVGFTLHNLTVSDHSPSVALTTTWFGPGLGPFLSLPFSGGDLGVDLRADLIAPFYVRESPQRSGAPRGAIAGHAGLHPWLRLGERFYGGVRLDLHRYRAHFDGPGNRWYGDIEGGEKRHAFWSAVVALEWLASE